MELGWIIHPGEQKEEFKIMDTKIKITYKELLEDAKHLAKIIKANSEQYDSVFGVPRGGVPIAIIVAEELSLPLVEEPTSKTLIVDDLIDSGETRKKYKDNHFAVLYKKPHSPITDCHYVYKELDGWIEFPYESSETDIEEHFRRILEYLGEDPTREGLRDTPKRYIKFMKQFLAQEEFNFTTFENEGVDEMIVQKDIPFFSLCEHHIAPFFGVATVAYIPNGRIVGLSKLARTVKYYAGQFQNQERITQQVAERLEKELKPRGVAVTLKARHFCMEMRGVRTHDVHTVTTKLTGAFKDNHDTRAEFLNSIK